MNQKEQRRLHVLNRLLEGACSMVLAQASHSPNLPAGRRGRVALGDLRRQAAELLGVSERHACLPSSRLTLWREDQGSRLTVVGAVDDATGTVPSAHFRLQEDAQGYFLIFRDILATQGIPLAVYRDRHGIFARAQKQVWTLEEELAGQPFPRHRRERCFQELGIHSIPAHSPQAQGRIERLWGTFQDHPVLDLRLAEDRALPVKVVALESAWQPRMRSPNGGAPRATLVQNVQRRGRSTPLPCG